jgi:4-hydroxy-tetrahydrodipicolinate synthase
MKNSKICTGVITALVTPFYKGKVDFVSIKKLVEHQLAGGVEGFVVNGTTGESPTLEEREVINIYKFVEKLVRAFEKKNKRKISLILGTGSNSTAEAIKKTRLAKKLKADAALIVVPYYNKPTQPGLVAHYKDIAKSVAVPIILYNVPGRTVISMQPATVAELAKVKNIIGIKEASGKIEVAQEIRASTPASFTLLSGDDATCIEFMKVGGEGVISVISHVIPSALRALSDSARKKDSSVTMEYSKFEKLNSLIGVEPNPIPVKMALYLMGIIRTAEMRLPLVEMTPENTAKLKAELLSLGLIK